MKILVTDIYQDFKCIGGECIKTCCKGWNIVIDSETVNKYRESSDPLCREMLNNLIPIDNSNDMQVKLDNDERCPMLNKDGLCRMVLSKGEEYLSMVCQRYPREVMKYNDTFFATVCPSCPEVARMIVERKDFITFALDEIPDDKNYDGIDWTLYNELINALVISTDVLQKIELPLAKRFAILLAIADIVDSHIKNNTVAQIRSDLKNLDFESISCQSLVFKEQYNPLNIVYSSVINNNHVPGALKEYLLGLIDKDTDFQKPSDPTLLDSYRLEYTNLALMLLFEFFMDVIKGISLKKNMHKMVTVLLVFQQLHLINISHKGYLEANDNILALCMTCSLLKHSSILNSWVDKLLNNRSDAELASIVNLIY